MRQDEIYNSGSVNFTAGQTITISGGVTVANGAKTTIKIDPAVK
jgi:hypothetical protein